MQKNKTLLIALSVLTMLLLMAGGYFLFFNKSSPKAAEQPIQTTNTGPAEISPDEIGLTLEASPDNKKVQFSLSRLKGINAIAYELTYEAESTDQERSEGADARIPRGITGEAKINSNDNSYKSPWLDLGSCSKNVCKYDKGINNINLILKITKDGKIYSTEKSLTI
jgi:hypothetical protein